MNQSLGDSSQMIIVIGGIAGVVGLALAIFGIAAWMKKGKKISTRIEHFVGSKTEINGDTNGRRIIQREIKGSLYNRTIMNWIRKILDLLGRFTPQKSTADIEKKLTIAGNPSNLHAREFSAIRLLMFIVGIICAFLVNRDFSNISMNSLLIGMGIIVVCMAMPGYWLKGKVRARQDEIRRGLPDALDMLSVCASAGLGFDQSLQKISNYWDTVLGLELKRVTQEMEMGVSRTIALRNLSSRLDVEDLSRFIALIIQAEKVGMSYADVLHSQAAQMRVQRQYRAREIANKLPGKMILPIALMIFPAMIAVILGPSIPILLDLF